MNLLRYYEIQKVIDSLRNSKKRMPRVLENIMKMPNPLYFHIYCKLELEEIIMFHNLFKLKVNKKLVIEFLDVLKYSDKFYYKLPVKYLQDIANFIDERTDRMTDEEYRHDMGILMSFY